MGYDLGSGYKSEMGALGRFSVLRVLDAKKVGKDVCYVAKVVKVKLLCYKPERKTAVLII